MLSLPAMSTPRSRRLKRRVPTATWTLLAVGLLAACEQSKRRAAAEVELATGPLESCAAVLELHETKQHSGTVRSVIVPDMEPVCEAKLEAVIRLTPPIGEGELLAGKSMSRRSDGFYVSNLFGENALAVWDSSGRFVRRIGRSGAGPGEFASGIQPIFGPGDTLYAIDNARHLNVFDNSFRYVRRSLQLNAQRPAGNWFLTVDGRRFVSPPPAGVRSHHVAELDADGSILKLLVPADSATTGPDVEQSERTIAHGGGDSFWIGPTQVPAQSYAMEEWSLDGRLLRRVRRSAAWFVPYHVADNGDPSGPPPTYFSMLQVDGSGLLHTAISSRERARRSPPGAGASREDRKAGISVRWEIIHPGSGTLVASTTFADVDSVPMPFIPHTNTALILSRDSADTYANAIARWRLSPMFSPIP